MSLKDQFSADEWESLAHGPFLVSTAIGMSDPSGPFQMVKESMALAGAVKHAIEGEAGELAQAVAGELRQHRPGRKDLVGDAKSHAEAREHAVAKLREIGDLADAKAGADAAPFKKWLAGLATSVAEAGKEGGFLGIGGESVSDAEEAAIAEIGSALA
jgi:hypothetical protein